MNMIQLQHKLSENWFEDLEDLQNDIIKEQPCMAFMALTYPTGNTGYFFAAACNDQYSCTTIGKPAYQIAMGALMSF